MYRIFELVADDNAISDTVYFLAKALNSERIDLAQFMKVRNYWCLCNALLNPSTNIVHSYVIQRAVYEESINQKNHSDLNKIALIYTHRYFYLTGTHFAETCH